MKNMRHIPRKNKREHCGIIPEGFHIKLNGEKMEPTFVFLPGLGADHRFFKYQTAAFPNSYAADWIDPVPNERLEHYAVRYAGRLRAELDKRPPAPVIVCGHSLGGMVAPHVARELDASACILLASIRSPDQFPRCYYPVWLLTRFCPPLQRALLFVGQLFARLFLCFSWLWGWFVSPKIVRAFAETPLFRLAGLFRMMFEWAYRRRLPEETGVEVFDKPTLHIHGTRDLLLPIWLTNPDICIKGAGQLFPLTYSEEVNDMIKQFAENLATPIDGVFEVEK
jgi:pimeloyl-ACP methyl ester carboxylesterase